MHPELPAAPARRGNANQPLAANAVAAVELAVVAARRLRQDIARDLAGARRLPSLLARAGSAEGWSPEDRRAAREALLSAARVGAWGVVLAVPGGVLLLPFVRPRARR